MKKFDRVVLAYSGGVDTSVCIPYLREKYGVSEVITFVADLGQGDDLESIRKKAIDSGAFESIVGDLVEPFIKEFAFPAIRANALYGDKYPLSTALFETIWGIILYTTTTLITFYIIKRLSLK